MQFEALEPRLLMAADFAGATAAALPSSVDLTLAMDTQANALVVLDNHQGGAEIRRINIGSPVPAAIVGTDGDDTFRIAFDPGLLRANAVYFIGGDGQDTLAGPAGGASWTLAAKGRGQVGNVGFWGIEHLDGSDAARDTLTGPTSGAVWTLDGEAKGTLLDTTFAGFEVLRGSARGADTFRIHPQGGSTSDPVLNGGAISIDGGGGTARDRIVVEGNHFLNAMVTKRGPGSGTFEIDGMTISHVGIENVHLGALDASQDVVKNYTFNAFANDTITVGDDAQDPLQVRVDGSDPNDVTTFDKPTASLTVNAQGTTSTVTLNTLTLHGVDLTVSAGSSGVAILPTSDDTNAITIAASSTLDTSLSGGKAGNITLEAMTIEVGANASIEAMGDSGGAVRLVADHRRVGTGFITDATNSVTSRKATINVDSNAIIQAGSIDIQALAGDWSLEGEMGNYADGAPEGVIKGFEQFQNFFGIPLSILYKRSWATIDVAGATLSATGSVSLDASAESDGIGSGTFFRNPTSIGGGLAFVYMQTDATATIDVEDGSIILSQKGDISITTEGTTNASGTARVSQNTGRQNSPTNPQNVQVAGSVARTSIVSTIDLGNTTVFAVNGDVSVVATGNNSNEQGAETESYKDGLAGFTLGLALSDATVKVTALGLIESGSPTPVARQIFFNPFTAVDADKDTIAAGQATGYGTGDALKYDPDLGGAVQGLKAGRTYYVIATDATHFQLAATRADALAGNAIDLGALPSLETTGGQRVAFSQVQESTGSIIFDHDPGLGIGQTVYYDAVAGQYIDGLKNKNTGDPTTAYTVASISKSAGGNQWLVALRDSSNAPVTLNLDPAIIDDNGHAFGFRLDGSALVVTSGPLEYLDVPHQLVTYRQALGFDIPTLQDGTDYFLVKDPVDTSGTVWRLARTLRDAQASDGYSNTVDLGTVDTTVTSNDEHILTAVNPGGVTISATLNTTDESVTKSGQGGEPETSDLAGKGEFLPQFGSIIGNVNSLATLPKDQDGNLGNPMDDKIAANAPQGSGSNSNFGVAATVAFVKSSNTALVEVGGRVRTGGTITIDADINHLIQTQAEGVKSPTQAGETTFTIAGAAAVGLSYDNAQVIIDPDAQIDASGAITIEASTTYPFIAPLDSPKDFGEYVLNQLASNPLGTISGFLGNVFLLKQDLVNSWARAVDNDSAADISIAGAVDFQHRNAFATIDVMGGTQINQDSRFRASGQSVSLDAETGLQMINVGGIFDYDLSPEGIIKSLRAGPSNSIQPYGAQGGKFGFGGAYRQLDLNSTTHALIHEADSGTGTAVYTDPSESLSLDAANRVFALGVTQSGTSSGKFGVSASGAYTQQTTDTIAAIEAGVAIDAGPVSVLADEDTVLPTFSGDVVKGKNLGFGGSFVYNDVNRTTQAYVGTVAGPTPAGAEKDVTDLYVGANTSGRYFGFALASATADNGPAADGGSHSAAVPNPDNPANNAPVNPGSAPSTGNYGLAVSGDVVFNSVTDVTEAVINQNGDIVSTGGMRLQALNDTELLALTGTAAIASGSNTNLGLAGSYSENQFIATTTAGTASDSNELVLSLGQSRTLSVAATQGGFASAVAAGGAGGIKSASKSTEIAGSVAINRVMPDNVARIQGTTVDTTGDIDVKAIDTIPIYALAGAASFGGKQGFGAAVALNFTNDGSNNEKVLATINGSTINQTGSSLSIDVTASIANPSNVDRIVAVAGSLGQGQGVAVSGTVAVNDLGVLTTNAVEASIIGSSIDGATTNGSIMVNASLNQTVLAVGGEVAAATGKSSTFAFGAGVAYNETSLPVVAAISNSSVSTGTLWVSSSIGGSTTAVSAGLAVANKSTGVAGSAAVNVIGDQSTAYIDQLSSTQKIQVSGTTTVAATDTTDFSAGAGELAAGTKSGGAAVAVNDLNTGTHAFVGEATVQTGALVVTADTSGKVTSVAVGADGGQDFTLGASVAVTATDSTTAAHIAGTDAVTAPATIGATGSIKVAAETGMTFITAAGTLAAVGGSSSGGVGAVGVANATLLRTDRTQAWVKAGSVRFGTAVPVDVKSASAGALVDGPGFTGLSVTAVASDDITTASGGTSVTTLDDFAGAGSVSVTIVDRTTQASVDDHVGVPATSSGSVNVLAYDDTRVSSGAGGLAAFSETGVGAGVDVVSLSKDTAAVFDPLGSVTLSGGLSVQALSKENLVSVAIGASLIDETAIAGAASAYVFDLNTTAAIGQTDVDTIVVGGSAQVAAQDDTVLFQLPGGVSLGTDVGVGGAVGVIDVKAKTVDASIGSGVTLTANASTDQGAIAAATGEFEVGFVASSGQTGDVPPPNVSIDTGRQTGDGSAPSIDNQNLTKVRTAAPVFETTRGIAVSAINTGKFKAINFAAGGAATAAVDLDAGVAIVNMTTTARILDNVSLVSGGDVVLAAGADLQKLGVSGSAAISGEASGAAGADVTLIDMTTRTDISGDGVTIQAGVTGDLIVNAQAQEDVFVITGAFAASGGVGLDAGASVIKIDNTTFAGISGLASLSAGGNVLIAAEDDTTLAAITGNVAIGLTGGAFGGSAVVTLITKNTTAGVTDGSTIDALADNDHALTVLDGTVSDGGDHYNTKTAQGVVIEARSSEDVTAVAVGGGGGLYVGAGAGVAYTSIDSDTFATVSPGVLINQAPHSASANQGVSINAANDVRTFTIGGGLGIGAAGLGGGVDVGRIHNDVNATVGGGTRISAVGEVDVFGLELVNLTSYAMSAGGGLVGIDGSVSVWNLGTGMSSVYTDGSQSADALQFNHGSGPNNSVLASGDAQTNRSDVTGLLGKYGSTNGANNGHVATLTTGASADYADAQPNGAVQTSFSDSSQSGVNAQVASGATVTAGALDVAASTSVESKQVTGGASIGVATFGASVGILNRGDNTQSLMDGTVSVSGALDVTARSVGNVTGKAFGGGASVLASLGAQVEFVNDGSSTLATIGSNAVVQRADGGVNVVAGTNTAVSLTVKGVDVSLVGVASGAGIAESVITGSTAAVLAARTVNVAYVVGGSVKVDASSSITANVESEASSGGLLASVVGNASVLDIHPTVTAAIDGGSNTATMETSGAVLVNASSIVDSRSKAKGFSEGGGVSVGYSVAQSTVDAAVTACIGANNEVKSGGLQMSASANDNSKADGTANAGHSLLGAGAGVVSSSNVTENIRAFILGDVVTDGNVNLTAEYAAANSEADANGLLDQGLVDVGYSSANAGLNATVLAYIDQGTVISTNGIGGIYVSATESSDAGATTVQAKATASQGVYSGGDYLSTQAATNHASTVIAAIGDPVGQGPSTARVAATGALTVAATSLTSDQPQARAEYNESFDAVSKAGATATTTKITEAFLAPDASASASHDAQFLATSLETFVPLAEGFASNGGDAQGTATVDVWLSRQTIVNIGAGSTLTAGSIVLDAESTTGNQGSLTDNQGNGTFNAAFHAGNSVSGTAISVSAFNIGLDAEKDVTPAKTLVFIGGALTAPTMSLTAHASYDLNVSSFAWVTAGAGTATLLADSHVNSRDSVNVQFSDAGTAHASQSIALDSGLAGSQVNVLNKLHYSEKIPPITSFTQGTVTMDGVVSLVDNDFLDAISSPNITSSVTGAPDPAINWEFTASSDNSHENWGTHEQTPTITVTTRNDWSDRNSSGAIAILPDTPESASSAGAAIVPDPRQSLFDPVDGDEETRQLDAVPGRASAPGSDIVIDWSSMQSSSALPASVAPSSIVGGPAVPTDGVTRQAVRRSFDTVSADPSDGLFRHPGNPDQLKVAPSLLPANRWIGDDRPTVRSSPAPVPWAADAGHDGAGGEGSSMGARPEEPEEGTSDTSVVAPPDIRIDWSTQAPIASALPSPLVSRWLLVQRAEA